MLTRRRWGEEADDLDEASIGLMRRRFLIGFREVGLDRFFAGALSFFEARLVFFRTAGRGDFLGGEARRLILGLARDEVGLLLILGRAELGRFTGPRRLLTFLGRVNVGFFFFFGLSLFFPVVLGFLLFGFEVDDLGLIV